MWVDIDHPANAGLLAYFASKPSWLSPGEAVSRDPGSFPQPYLTLGTHPDIVERFWDEITVPLPESCRWVVHHRPVLVHPWTGVIFGFAQGVPTYVLRLPELERQEALAAGAKTEFTYSAGQKRFDLREIGEEWLFGGWFEQEARWCLAACNYAEAIGRRT
jgi:hypothetical protein